MLAMSDEYYRVCVLAWAGEVANRYGQDTMREIQSESWHNIVVPQLRAMLARVDATERATRPTTSSPAVAADVDAHREDGGVVTINPFEADPKYQDLSQRPTGQAGCWAATSTC